MGFFGWLGNLVDDFLDWLGEAFRPFINALVEILQSMWDSVIESLIYEYFGDVEVISFIIIERLGKILIQLWNPKNRQKGSIMEELGTSRSMLPTSKELPPPITFSAKKK